MKKEDFDTLPAVVREFLTYLEVIRAKSPLTVSEYAFDLRTFLRFLKISRGLASPADDFEKIEVSDIGIEFIEKITLMDAYAFLKFCIDNRSNNASTRSRKVSCIRSFFKYLNLKTGQLSINPMAELDSPKLKSSLPRYLTLDQSVQLLDSIEGANAVRDFAIITLFLNCGLRLSELVGLNLSDIRDDGTIRVTGKGNKERTLYINDACRNAVTDYLKVRPVDGVKDKNALFLSSRKQRISPKTVQYLTKTFLEKAGMGGQGYSAHKLRHTAATLMYQHGKVDVLVLKEILGHSNLGTTEIYTHIADESLKAAAAANPLSGVRKSKKTESSDS